VDVRIGTSGWLYPHWKKIFYPERLPDDQRLGWVAGHFNSVEINGTFYSLQWPDSFARWRRAVPPGFVFSVKASRYITHMLKLRNAGPALGNFFAQGLLLLGAQLGPILWQLPPMLGFDAERARAFFEALPRDVADAERIARRHDRRVSGRSVLTAPDGREHVLRHALEVRHPSWLGDAAVALMIEQGIALVHADTAGRFPFSLTRTADFAYARLHGAQRLYGSNYGEQELAMWAQLVGSWRDDGSDVYVYFDNDNKAYAPGNALALAERLRAEHRATGMDSRA
jgi:uncharacterized protein YecE (DUF72 family)